MTDPVADMLSRIRNGIHRHRENVLVEPDSRLKRDILEVFVREGFISGYSRNDKGAGGALEVNLKYTKEGRSVINQMEKVSKGSRRVYVGKKEIPWVRSGLGIVVLSTSQGLLSDREARAKGLGGEVICRVW